MLPTLVEFAVRCSSCQKSDRHDFLCAFLYQVRFHKSVYCPEQFAQRIKW
jgi:hypothetical protein